MRNGAFKLWRTSQPVISKYKYKINTRKFNWDSLISGKVSYIGWTLSTGFGSESVFRCSDVCTTWLLIVCVLCQSISNVPGCRHLRSTDRGHLEFPCVRLSTYGGRAFAYAGSSNWNSLPAHMFLSQLSNATLRPFFFPISTCSAFGVLLQKRAI